MKKILLLGGSRYILPVINSIHELGHYAITCDYIPDNIAHKYSDEYHNVSIIDKEAVLDLAIKLDIDGILSFACDPGVLTAAYVAEKLDLPSVGSYDSVSILQNKAKFRHFLESNGFNVPRSIYAKNLKDVLYNIDKLKFPVIVKPVDSAGSKGVSKVSTKLELESSIENALKFSISREVIIEEFIEKKGDSSDSDCFVVDGKLVYMSFSNQKFDDKAVNPYVPAGFTWPSDMSQNNQNILCNEIQRLLSLLDMKTAIYNIETRIGINGLAYIMEVSPRGGGNRLAEVLEYATGADLIKNTVRACVGDPLVVIKQPIYNDYWAEIILHADESGFFDGIEIAPVLNEFVVQKDIWVKSGDRVDNFTGANTSLGTLILEFNSKSKMDNMFENISKYVKVCLK